MRNCSGSTGPLRMGARQRIWTEVVDLAAAQKRSTQRVQVALDYIQRLQGRDTGPLSKPRYIPCNYLDPLG